MLACPLCGFEFDQDQSRVFYPSHYSDTAVPVHGVLRGNGLGRCDGSGTEPVGVVVTEVADEAVLGA